MPRTKKDNKDYIEDKTKTPPANYDGLEVAKENNQELLKILQKVSNDNNAVLIAFIAPPMGKKVSPVDYIGASISLWEELGIEQTIRDIEKEYTITKDTKLFILIESPGGLVSSSYKISKFLRGKFNKITAYVPHVAASGGTLVAFSADGVVMGDMANLSPIDVQIPYEGTRVSVNRMSSVLTRLTKHFETKLPQQVPYPYRALVDKLDPIIYDDWESKTYVMVSYAVEILEKAGYKPENIKNIVNNFIYTPFPHDYVITKDRAIEYGVNIVPDENEVLNCMTWWLKHYIQQPGTDHYIRYVVPITELLQTPVD